MEMYKGHYKNKLQNGVILLICKNRTVRFVGNSGADYPRQTSHNIVSRRQSLTLDCAD